LVPERLRQAKNGLRKTRDENLVTVLTSREDGRHPADSDDTLLLAELTGVRLMIETYSLENGGRGLRGNVQFRDVLTM